MCVFTLLYSTLLYSEEEGAFNQRNGLSTRGDLVLVVGTSHSSEALESMYGTSFSLSLLLGALQDKPTTTTTTAQRITLLCD